MDIDKYINDKKELYQHLIMYLDNSSTSNKFDQLIELINKEELEHFLQLISSISNNHHREPDFFNKLIQIMLILKDDIHQTFSNIEIFNIFMNNKLFILYLFKANIITFDDDIFNTIYYKFEKNCTRYCYFFIPEIKSYAAEKKLKQIENDLSSIDSNILENYEEKRLQGENDSHICSLIRQDASKDFISYTNKFNIPLTNTIRHSIFETNSILVEQDATFIDYAAFYGSIEIFQYLIINHVPISSSVWIYAIHSNNTDFIINYVEPALSLKSLHYEDYSSCFIESIKCHQNDIAKYIQSNSRYSLSNNVFSDGKFADCILHYHNYLFFSIDLNQTLLFFYFSKYNYNEIAQLFIEKAKDKINSKGIFMKFNIFILNNI